MENKEEKKIAADIMNILRKLGLPFKLDKITEGKRKLLPIGSNCSMQQARNIQ